MKTPATFPANTTHDAQLWQLAHDRAKFKASLGSYLLSSGVLWTIWLLTGHPTHGHSLPWPAWVMLFWGLGLLIKAVSCYGLGTQSLSEREYEQLLRERQNDAR